MAESDPLVAPRLAISRNIIILFAILALGVSLLTNINYHVTTRSATELDGSLPSSARDARSRIHAAYIKHIESGRYLPFTYPLSVLGLYIVLAFLMIPATSRCHNKATRYITFAIVFAFYAWIIQNCRTQNVLPGFGAGILSSWVVVWTATLLVFHDAKTEFKRIITLDCSSVDNSRADKRKIVSEIAMSPLSLLRDDNVIQNIITESTQAPHGMRKIAGKKFKWQGYPTSFIDRLEWSIDILTNLRGVGWNWRPPSFPPPPYFVRKSLSEQENDKQPSSLENSKDATSMDNVARNGIRRFDNFSGVIFHNVYLLVKGFILLDILITIGRQDPYFWGYVELSAPGPSYLPSFILGCAPLLRAYRLFVSMCLIWLSVQTLCAFSPLFFVGCFGSSRLGTNGEPWLFPDHFGNYSSIFTGGLRAWWSRWWHQNFRFAFQSGGIWVSSLLGLHYRSSSGRTVQLFVVFALSGLIHAAGSITMTPETQPWSGSFLFFMIQPLGILAETLWNACLRKTGISGKIPRSVAYTANFAFVHLWFYYTGPLVTDDFARGGIWLYEPFIISIARGLGFGGDGDGLFCWQGKWSSWYSNPNGKWWLNGLSF